MIRKLFFATSTWEDLVRIAKSRRDMISAEYLAQDVIEQYVREHRDHATRIADARRVVERSLPAYDDARVCTINQGIAHD